MDEPSTAQVGGTELAALPVGIVCPDCGYDLRGSTSARCPECGFALEVLRVRETLIPWSHRRELGRCRAYWKTVWLVLRYPKRFCLEMSRPVSYRDSQSFRWMTTAHAYVPNVIAAAVVYYLDHRDGAASEDELWILAGVLIWALLALVLLPGLAGYFFHPRRLAVQQQNRAIALSYYAWAPLALWSFALPLLVAMPVLEAYSESNLNAPGIRDDIVMVLTSVWASCSILLWVGAPLLVYARLADFAWRTQHQRGLRGLLRMAFLWLLSAALLVLLALPFLLVFYLLVIFHSLC